MVRAEASLLRSMETKGLAELLQERVKGFSLMETSYTWATIPD